MLVTDELEVDESEGDWVDEMVKVEVAEGEFDKLVDTLGDVVLEKQVVGELD